LYYVDAVGIASKVKYYKVLGTGDYYAHLFIKPSHPEYANMQGMAVLAAFIILLIDEFKIDETVGIEKDGDVQIWMIPNSGNPYELHGSDLEGIMLEARKRLEKFTPFMIMGKTKL
jgi:hypothetical protein